MGTPHGSPVGLGRQNQLLELLLNGTFANLIIQEDISLYIGQPEFSG